MENIQQEWLNFFEWCKQNNKDPKNYKSLNEYVTEIESDKK